MSNSASSSRGEFVLWAAPALALLTLAVSLAVSFVVNGTAFSTVPVKDLAKWGGLRLSTFDINDSWRVLTAQLVHVRWPHMLFNVVCLAAVSSLVERRIGAAGTLLIWALIGGAATAVSPVFVKPPYDVGTGASQAVLAFAGYAIVMRVRGGLKGGRNDIVIALSVLPALALDMVFAGYPKIGHITALFGGIAAGFLFFPGRRAQALKRGKDCPEA